MNYGAPSPDYLALINSTLSGGPPPAGPVLLGAQNGASPPGPALPGGAPLPPPPQQSLPPAGPPRPPLPDQIGPPRPAPGVDAPVPGEPPQAPPAAPQAAPFLRQISGGGVVNVPAKETELRGPHLQAAQGLRNEAYAGAVHDVTARTQDAVASDYALALHQERQAADREDAANVAAAERNQELQDRQQDFDASVKSLSQMSVDPNRFWANASTGAKITALITATLGGFVSQQNGGHNLGLEEVHSLMNNDIKAQEVAYQIGLGTANAKQTAFSMAMDKYRNVDMARAAARAAALDTTQAQLAQQAALWKGTEAANHATNAYAALQDEKMQQTAQGIAFQPARQVAVGAQYIDPRTGFKYSEQEAKGLVGKLDEREFEREKIGLNTAGEIIKEGAKVDKTTAKDQRAESVQLPNGDVVRARDPVQARELSEAAASIHETQRLVKQAKEIRSSEGFRAPNSQARARLTQIQKNLITQYAVQHKLGAISGPDMELATGGTASLFDVGSGPEAALDGLLDTAQANLRNQVKTIPGAPGSAKGDMPTSFTPHGAK